MSILNNNKVLAAAEQKVEAGLQPETRGEYMKIVVNGMKAALKNGEAGILASLKKSKDPLADCAVGAVNLVLMMNQASRGTMSQKALIPASATLMFQALEFADKVRVVKVGSEELNRAMKIWVDHIMKLSKVTPQALARVGARVDGIMNDPTSMEMLARRAGTVRDPRSSTPTDMLAKEKP